MTYRDDHEAAVMRADAAERETARLAKDHERLAAELAAAKEWLGGPRRRMLLLAAVIAIGSVFGFCGVLLGRGTATCPTCPTLPPPPTLPAIVGVMVADGPKVGHWTLTATRCVLREDGIELTAAGSEDHNLWLNDQTVEIEFPAGDFFISQKECKTTFDFALIKHDDGYEGHVSLDCRFADNRLQGRIDFKRCR